MYSVLNNPIILLISYFSCYAWKLETNKPLHREVGFVRVKPSTDKVALIIAQNIG